MSDETPTKTASPSDPSDAEAHAHPARGVFVPRWFAGLVAALILMGIGFGIGRVSASGGGHEHREHGMQQESSRGGDTGPGGEQNGPGSGPATR